MGAVGVYSRVPYDSWPFNAMSGAHSGIKPEVGKSVLSDLGVFVDEESKIVIIEADGRNEWAMVGRSSWSGCRKRVAGCWSREWNNTSSRLRRDAPSSSCPSSNVQL